MFHLQTEHFRSVCAIVRLHRRPRRRDRALRLQRMGDAQRHVLAPGRGDDLHARSATASSGTGTATTGRPMNEIGWV